MTSTIFRSVTEISASPFLKMSYSTSQFRSGIYCSDCIYIFFSYFQINVIILRTGNNNNRRKQKIALIWDNGIVGNRKVICGSGGVGGEEGQFPNNAVSRF